METTRICLIDGDPTPPEGYTNMAFALIANFAQALGDVQVSVAKTVPEIESAAESGDRIDLVGVSIRDTAIAPDAYALIENVKSMGLQVLAGGIHPSKNPEECARHSDSVCVGFLDQQTLEDIVRDLRSGVVSQYYHPKPTAVPVVRGSMDRMETTTSILTGVGCNFSCDFCTIGFPGIKGRIDKSLADFAGEVERVETERVVFVDSNFGDYLRKDREKIEILKRSGKKWSADISINYLRNPKFIEDIASAGCKEVYIGFESINEESLKSIHKGHSSVSDYARIIKDLHQHGIIIRGAFVVGFDQDSPETVRRTVDFIIENGVDFPNIKLLTPYPGTALYDSFKEKGRLLFRDEDRPDIFRRFDRRHTLFTPTNFKPRDMECAPDYFYRRIYDEGVVSRKLADARGYLGDDDFAHYRRTLKHYMDFDLATLPPDVGIGSGDENAEHFAKL